MKQIGTQTLAKQFQRNATCAALIECIMLPSATASVVHIGSGKVEILSQQAPPPCATNKIRPTAKKEDKPVSPYARSMHLMPPLIRIIKIEKVAGIFSSGMGHHHETNLGKLFASRFLPPHATVHKFKTWKKKTSLSVSPGIT